MAGRRYPFAFALPLAAFLGIAIIAQQPVPSSQFPSSALSGLRWRDVGPMRGGRDYAVAGHADQPDTFYFGSVGGGVWKTENAGRTWFPISDEGIPIGSIGAIAVAPSNANIVYVGTGETDIRSQHSYGIGMYKSLTPANPGATSGSMRHVKSGASWWTRPTRIASSWPLWATSTPPLPIAASIVRGWRRDLEKSL